MNTQRKQQLIFTVWYSTFSLLCSFLRIFRNSLRQFHLGKIGHTQKFAFPWVTARENDLSGNSHLPRSKTASVDAPNVMLSTVFPFLSTGLYEIIFMIGLTVDVIKDMVQQGRVRFFSYHWNYLAVATVVSYGIYLALWFIDITSRVRVVTLVFLRTLAILMGFVHNLSFFQANTSIGPLLNAFIQMLTDVAKFFVYFFFFFLAFAVSLTELYAVYFVLATPQNGNNPKNLERCVQPC